MATYNNRAFTEQSVKIYSAALRSRLPRVRFMLDKDDAVKTATERGLFRRIGETRTPVLQFALDDHMTRDGQIDQEQLAQAVADAFLEPLVTIVQTELMPEIENPLRRIGAGQLWVVHDTIVAHDTNGRGQVDFVEADHVGLLGQTWYDIDGLKNTFTARAKWSLVKSMEVQKEAINKFDRLTS